MAARKQLFNINITIIGRAAPLVHGWTRLKKKKKKNPVLRGVSLHSNTEELKSLLGATEILVIRQLTLLGCKHMKYN